MTQERLPKVWDAIHVFLLAFGFYFMTGTLGMEFWWFFLAISLYEVLATIATVYNVDILARSLARKSGWRIFTWNILSTSSCVVIYSVAAWASKQELLHSGVEIFLCGCFILLNIHWIYCFWKGWSRLMEDIG